MKFSHIGPAVGKAILSPHDNGRTVMVPLVCTVMNDTTSVNGDHGLCPLCRSCIGISRDGGQSWRLGGVAQSGSRESQLALLGLKSSHLYVTERNMGTGNGHRMQSWSPDMGASLLNTSVNLDLPEPVTANWTGIVGSVTSWPTAAWDPVLFYSGPCSSDSRSNLTLFHSIDGELVLL